MNTPWYESVGGGVVFHIKKTISHLFHDRRQREPEAMVIVQFSLGLLVPSVLLPQPLYVAPPITKRAEVAAKCYHDAKGPGECHYDTPQGVLEGLKEGEEAGIGPVLCHQYPKT